eukprot:sb/3477427/
MSSNTPNKLPRIMFHIPYQSVLEECEKSETLARQLLGTIYNTTFKNQTCCRLLSFFTRDPDNARRLFSTYLINDLKKYVKELLFHGKSSMNCPKKEPFCHYIEDELIV